MTLAVYKAAMKIDFKKVSKTNIGIEVRYEKVFLTNKEKQAKDIINNIGYRNRKANEI